MAYKVINKGLKRTALSVALGMCFAGSVLAQSNTTGNISGTTTAGGTVTIENEATGFRREITADENGTYRVSSLPSGTYKVTAGGQTREVTVQVGTTANIGTVEVVGSGVINPIDVSSVESTTIMTEAVIDRLPIARNVTSVALLAPGTVQGDAGFGNLASFGGATVGENAYYINGFNVTNFRNGLGFSNVPFEMYEEFQVKTGGYGAEFGRSTGGVVNAVTKRGSNEFHWGVNLFWNPEGLQGNSPDIYDNLGVQAVENTRDQNETLTANAYVSGAIVKDHLFFYAIGQYRDVQVDNYSVTGALTESQSDNPFYGLKLDWQINDNHRLEYTGFQDSNVTVNAGEIVYNAATDIQGSFTDIVKVGYEGPVATATETGGKNHILKYTGYLTDNFTMSALYGRGEYQLSFYNDGASADPDCRFVVWDTLDAAARQIGCAPVSLDSRNNVDVRKAYRLDFEWDLGEFLWGSHFLRFGMDRENNHSSQRTNVANGHPYRYTITQRTGYYDPDLPICSFTNFQLGNCARANEVAFAHGRWRVTRDEYLNNGEFDTVSRAFYIEDQWRPTDNLLINVGLRNEAFDNRNADGVSFIKINDQWAPRIGFAWDVGGEGTFKVFGNYGRYHLPVAANTNVRLAGQELYLRTRWNWVPDPNNFNPDGTPILGAFQSGSVFADGTVHPTISSVDQEIDPMYQDEWILGFQRQIGKNWTVGIRAAYRDLKSTLEDMAVDAALNRYIEENNIAPSYDCDYDGVNESVVGACGFGYYVLGNPGQPISISVDIDGDGDLDAIELDADILGYPASVRKYKALEFFFERAWDGKWFLQGSYTWSKSYGNNEGFVRSDNEQTDAGLTTLFDQPGLLDGAYGYLPNDRRHQIKVFGAYQINDEWQINGNLLIRSGRPKNCFGNHPTDGFAFQYDTESFYCNGVLVPRGSLGRTPWVYNFDAGVEYRPAWADKKLGFKMDITNLFNEAHVTEIYEVGELPFDIGNPDPRFGTPTNFQAPRGVRFSVSYDW